MKRIILFLIIINITKTKTAPPSVATLLNRERDGTQALAGLTTSFARCARFAVLGASHTLIGLTIQVNFCMG